MIKKSNKVKREQLGVSLATAHRRLTKAIIFDFLKRLNENKCFRCGKEIESINDLSIDHKKPWLHENIALFWDVGNIAFSHLKCNSGARRSVRKWKDNKEGNRKRFARLYADPIKRERLLKQRREKYKARSSTLD